MIGIGSGVYRVWNIRHFGLELVLQMKFTHVDHWRWLRTQK